MTPQRTTQVLTISTASGSSTFTLTNGGNFPTLPAGAIIRAAHLTILQSGTGVESSPNFRLSLHDVSGSEVPAFCLGRPANSLTQSFQFTPSLFADAPAYGVGSPLWYLYWSGLNAANVYTVYLTLEGSW